MWDFWELVRRWRISQWRCQLLTELLQPLDWHRGHCRSWTWTVYRRSTLHCSQRPIIGQVVTLTDHGDCGEPRSGVTGVALVSTGHERPELAWRARLGLGLETSYPLNPWEAMNISVPGSESSPVMPCVIHHQRERLAVLNTPQTDRIWPTVTRVVGSLGARYHHNR